MNFDEGNNLYTVLNTFSRRNDWPNLEPHFYQLACQHAGPELASLIRSVDLTDYTARLQEFLYQECLRLSHHAVRALYFEFDPAHLWDSRLFICDRYTRGAAGDETWASHWIDSVSGPNLPEFARLYQQHGGLNGKNETETAVSFYMIARTVAAYGKAVDSAPTHKMAVCIGHRGQARLTRVLEYPMQSSAG